MMYRKKTDKKYCVPLECKKVNNISHFGVDIFTGNRGKGYINVMGKPPYTTTLTSKANVVGLLFYFLSL